jgi:hypothetical protein
VIEGSVSAASGSGAVNPLETAGSTVSDSPDLQSVSGTDGGAGNDTVLYTFDEGLTAAPAAGSFQVYRASGVEVPGSGVTWSGAVNNKVLVSFPSGTLDAAVGASVDTGAGTGVGGNTIKAAELPLSGAPSTVRTPGFTTGPQLTGVQVKATDALGTVYVAVYTFDEKVTVGDDSQFFLYESNGVRHVATAASCVVGTAPNDNQITCGSLPGATADAVHRSVAGTVGYDAAEDAGLLPSTEGAKPVTGTSGTPQT